MLDPRKVKKDPYSVLGLEKDATADEIKKTYRKLAIGFHPDKTNGDRAKEDKFKEFVDAYATIGDDENRKIYDDYIGLVRQTPDADTSEKTQIEILRIIYDALLGRGAFDRYLEALARERARPRAVDYSERIEKGATLTFFEDTIISTPVPDDVIINARNARLKIARSMGKNVTICQHENYGDSQAVDKPGKKAEHALTYGVEIRCSVGDGLNVETDHTFSAWHLGYKNTIKAVSIKLDDMKSDNRLEATGKDGVVLNDMGRGNKIKSAGGVTFDHSQHGLDIEATGDVKGKTITDQSIIKAASVILKRAGDCNDFTAGFLCDVDDMGRDNKISSGSSVKFKNSKENLTVTKAFSVTGYEIGDYSTIKASKIELGGLGHHVSLVSSWGPVAFMQARDHLSVETPGNVMGGDIGSYCTVKAKAIALDDAGHDNTITAVRAAQLKHMGERNMIRVNKGSAAFKTTQQGVDITAEMILAEKEPVDPANLQGEFMVFTSPGEAITTRQIKEPGVMATFFEAFGMAVQQATNPWQPHL